MKKRTIVATFALLLLLCGVLASKHTVIIGGQSVDKQATRLTFNGDSVILDYTDGTLQTADMASVELKFQSIRTPKGDVNRDGAVDVADISTIISVMSGDKLYKLYADVNGDGTVDVADIATVISIMAGDTSGQSTTVAEAQQWDFAKTIDADVAALAADTDNWSYTEASNRYESKVAFNGELTAGQTVLELTKGLSFNAAAKKIRIDVGKRVQLAGKGISITIPGLTKGQQVTVTFASTGDNAVTFDNLTNLSDAEGFEAADKSTTQTGTATVAEDGAVSFASTGGSINIFSIEVSAIEKVVMQPTEPVIATTGDSENVPRDTKQNQAVLTLTTGEVEYFNTVDIDYIDIDESDNVVLMLKNMHGHMFAQTLSSISFAKGQQGQEPHLLHTIHQFLAGVDATHIPVILMEMLEVFVECSHILILSLP